MEELIDEIELTSLFNKLSDGSKNINSENALEIIYKLGYVPSKEDIEEFVYVTNGSCTLSNIKKFCNKLRSSKYSTENLIDLFYFYDTKKTGKISKKMFKILFTTVGSKLSNKEIDIITSELCNDEEFIDYKEFLDKFFN
ncbi:myosin light chain, putative [Plasmodium gallinaceum]|uniref:Myosin light chain, putative n=1 Tax=Plasmodium gallinaceum TaxID=5849 RepID=A0A1J1GRD8_PLAGA|nr:myosin light chain, putative [Plasmodium gallinaceum]CRG93848.1 myosin light chain, putative [Plasmodium gallinaceum]